MKKRVMETFICCTVKESSRVLMAYPFFCLISPLPLFLGLRLRLGPGGSPLFLDQKEARRAEKNFFLGLLAPIFPLSEGLDPSLICYR